MKFSNDEYTLDIDDLGYKMQVDVIRDLIIEADTPFFIGVSGRWGSGKTSLMKYLMASLGGEPLESRLDSYDDKSAEKISFFNILNNNPEYKNDKKNIHTIWFNPWENENHKEPMVGLLQEIYSHFSFYVNSKKTSKKLLSVAMQSGLDMLGSFLGIGKNQGTNIINIGEKYEHDSFQYIDRNQKFKFIFQEAIENLLINLENTQDLIDKDARIVIFIDDLDRCEDETIAKLLKEIKQYLATKRCVFVFGYDRHHIEKSLSKTETKTNKETRAYLEKLFQTTFYIKEPVSDKLDEFVSNIIKEYGFVKNEKMDEFTKFINSIIDPNPRRLKSYLTSLYFHVKNSLFMDENKINLDDLKKLALMAYLKVFYESVYTVIENQPSLFSVLSKFIENNNLEDITDNKEYFFSLEFKNHLDIENKNMIEQVNTKESEEKFLDEVYEMQGKHKSFSMFRIELVNCFENENFIEKYL